MILFFLILTVLLFSGFGGWAALGGVAGGLYGAKKDKDQMERMMAARMEAIKKMIKQWRKGHEASRGQFDAARQQILGAHQSALGESTARMAGAGLLNTTVAPNMARGVASDTSQSLTGLASAQAASEYGQWMDLAALKGLTPYDNITPPSQAQMYGKMGAQIGGIDWSSLF